MRRRTICHLLTVALVLTAMGADYLQSAGMVVRAETVVEVAGRMADRFTQAFPRRVHQSTPQILHASGWAVVRPEVRWMDQQRPHQALRCSSEVLYLPPPIA
jgi:hypothetical protein